MLLFERPGPRRLLLHKREINKLADAIDRKGLTVVSRVAASLASPRCAAVATAHAPTPPLARQVPLSAYFNEKSFLKISIGLARGKKMQDKREDLKRRDIDRDTKRQIKAFG